jgi:hypothetical protein
MYGWIPIANCAMNGNATAAQAGTAIHHATNQPRVASLAPISCILN